MNKHIQVEKGGSMGKAGPAFPYLLKDGEPV